MVAHEATNVKRYYRTSSRGTGSGSIAAELVSAYEAKTHLSKLLERAARGERFVITRHGKPMAQRIPFESGDDASVTRALDRVAVLRVRIARQGVTLASIREAGETTRELSRVGADAQPSAAAAKRPT